MKLLHNLTLKNIDVARYLLLATAVLAVFLTWLLGNPFAMGFAMGAFAALIDALRSRYLDALDRRMAAVAGPVWDIELNRVKVGTISDAEYAAIRRKCFTDPRLYVAQVMNALRVIVMFTVVAMRWALGPSRFGFIDRFDEAAGTALLKHCKAAAEGSIVLVRWTDGVLHVNDELAHIRQAKSQ